MRLNISIPDDELEAIDGAAEAVGETRSEYLRKAALERAKAEERGLTSAQRRELVSAFRRMIEGF